MVVIAYERLQIWWFHLETFGILKKKPGRLPEIVAYKRMLQLEVQMLFEEPIELGKFLKLWSEKKLSNLRGL